MTGFDSKRKMALAKLPDDDDDDTQGYTSEMRQAVAEAYRCGYKAGAEAEREAIAKLAEAGVNADKYPTLTECAAAIRARGNT